MLSKVLTVILAVVFVLLLIDRLATPVEGTIICGIGNCFCMAYGNVCGCELNEGDGFQSCFAVCFSPAQAFPIFLFDFSLNRCTI